MQQTLSVCVILLVAVIGSFGGHVGAQKGLSESSGGIAGIRKQPGSTTTKKPILHGLIPRLHGAASGGKTRGATGQAAGAKQTEQPSQNSGQKNKPPSAATEKPKSVTKQPAAASRNNAPPPLLPTKKPAGDTASKKSTEPVAGNNKAVESGKKH